MLREEEHPIPSESENCWTNPSGIPHFERNLSLEDLRSWGSYLLDANVRLYWQVCRRITIVEINLGISLLYMFKESCCMVTDVTWLRVCSLSFSSYQVSLVSLGLAVVVGDSVINRGYVPEHSSVSLHSSIFSYKLYWHVLYLHHLQETPSWVRFVSSGVNWLLPEVCRTSWAPVDFQAVGIGILWYAFVASLT